MVCLNGARSGATGVGTFDDRIALETIALDDLSHVADGVSGGTAIGVPWVMICPTVSDGLTVA